MQPPITPKKRIVVLGGGMASLAAVFELTSQHGWQERYEITVYQQGHRLGGKCASARAVRNGVERIEEHGLHVFFGFYDNAFALMRRVYEELERIPKRPLEQRLTFETAFLPNDLILLGEERGNSLDTWTLPFPARSGAPGSEQGGEDRLTLGSVLSGLLELAAAQLLSVVDCEVHGLGSPREHQAGDLSRQLDGVRQDSVDLFPSMLQALRTAHKLLRKDTNPDNLIWALNLAKEVAGKLDTSELAKSSLLRTALGGMLQQLRALFRVGFEAIRLRDFRYSQLGVSVDLALTFAIGILSDKLLLGDTDWFSLDHIEYREWLRRHGARAETIDSPPLATLADATFSDTRYNGAGAGTTLHLTLRMLLHYKGAILFKLAAGMGETVIAPLYQVLSARGVKFKFFHRIENLIPGFVGDTPIVSGITFKEQVKVRPSLRGSAEYQPLVRSATDGLLCFPEHPLFDQLEEGEQIAHEGHNLENSWNTWDRTRELHTLKFGHDYDCVVLGISVGALRSLCSPLFEVEGHLPPVMRGANKEAPRLSKSVAEIATVETMAAQLWLEPEFSELGAPASSGLGINYPQPFDTWSDMTHLLKHEHWPASSSPRSVIYLCTAIEEPHGYEPPPFDDAKHPERQRALVRRSLQEWLKSSAPRIFHGLRGGPRGFAFDRLVDPDNRSGVERLAAQWACTSENPSDRYVLSVPGTNRFRLRAHESGFANLLLAGDWTLNALSAGCVEGAVISGLEISRALIGDTRPILGDWLTRVRPELACGNSPLLPRLPVDPARAPAPENGRVLPFPGLAGKPAEREQAGSLSSLPELQYFRRPFDLIPRPPYICRETQTDWFFFRADEAKLQAMCDRMLNHPESPTVYRPAVPVVAFVAAQLGKTYPADEPIAYMPEKDYAFWIPVRAEAKDGRADEHVASPTAWLQPCLWVDSHPAVIGGREVYGVNKALAQLGVPTTESPKFTIDTIAIKKENEPDGGEPDQLAEQARVLELLGDDFHEETPASAVVGAFGGLVDLAKKMLVGDGSFGDLSLLWELYRLLSGGGIPLVALKFFPDAADPTKACYDALVEVKSTLLGDLHLGIRTGNYELRLFNFDSHPIADWFGLTIQRVDDENGALVKPFFAISARFDFALEKGRIIYDFMNSRRASDAAASASSA